jgi:hypothetical protein
VPEPGVGRFVMLAATVGTEKRRIHAPTLVALSATRVTLYDATIRNARSNAAREAQAPMGHASQADG